MPSHEPRPLFAEARRSIVRDVNAWTRNMGALLDPTRRWPFLCECGHATCREPVRLTVHEYDELSDSHLCLVVAPGHETTSLRHVVKRTERFVVVELDRMRGEDVR